MLKNYFKIAFRTLWYNKVYSFINIGGLAVGMSATILLFLWVQDELSYDQFHKKRKNIYRVIAHIKAGEGEQAWSDTPAPIAAFGKREIPEIYEAVRIKSNWKTYLFTYQDKQFTESNSAYVDASFFTVFDFPFLKGNPKKPFLNNQSIIITESMANKYFGNSEPMGKVIQIEDKGYMVSGVIENIPSNSSIQYEIFFPFDILIKDYQSGGYWKSLETNWGDFYYNTYFLLQPNASAKRISEKVNQLEQSNNPSDSSTSYSLQSLSDIHLYTADGNDNAMLMVRIFFIVAIIVLLIACINYVNLVTARATQRAKEIGVRKIIGANKTQLFGQFLGESIIIIALALLIALLLIQLLIPAYNELSGKQLTLSLANASLVLIISIAIVATVLTAGVYPALLLSSFHPLQVIKGKFLRGSNNVSFRKILVVIQFTFSIALIICTLVIAGQLNYIYNRPLGYDKENVFMVGMRGDMNKHLQSLKNELLKHSSVLAVTASNGQLLNIGNTTGDVAWDSKGPEQPFIIHPIAIEKDFIEVFNMELVEGRSFTDSKADAMAYILNETAIKQMGIQSPIGKRFSLWEREGTIIGVVKDFHISSIHNKIEPVVFLYEPEWNGLLYVKTTKEGAPKAIAAAEAMWKKFNPNYPFEFTFLDEAFDSMYKADQRTKKLFVYFASIAILLSCLGLFGLVTYTAEQRTKEIGIRKVLGASVSNIAFLLSRNFLWLVLLANLLAYPLAWWGMRKWLENFAYRIELQERTFLIAGFIAIIIAISTVSYQSIKAALANPVDSLKNE